MSNEASHSVDDQAFVEISNVTHYYGDVRALRDVSLGVARGEFLSLLGPSGSGKTTLLRILAGIELPRAGAVRIRGRDVTLLPPEARGIGVVFQNYALFPHMSVSANIGYPLQVRRLPKAQIRTRVDELLDLVDLTGYGPRRPSELSGGQQQRVALARALAFHPELLLLDEPFGALDRRLREQLGLAVRLLQRELGVTTIFVTHDQDEAFTMSTRIAVMHEGELMQIAEPTTIYRTPSDIHSARTIGTLNEFQGTVISEPGERVSIRITDGSVHRDTRTHPAELRRGASVSCAVRPEHVRVSHERMGESDFTSTVLAAIEGGGWRRFQVKTAQGLVLMSTASGRSSAVYDGDDAYVGFADNTLMMFDAESGSRLI
ncbi:MULTISPECIES: ABC transporter ATP-binding protein [unclassified Mesorhizobium]|uniref:ABC transporter ATP-binding protein n=1 Tax=unclassified Mesorhizobium TaxID=325217 RepID=UPI001676681D|nr:MULTISPECIES: ABC transporter ATP-binding protein [unclassified Mesorhizobium]